MLDNAHYPVASEVTAKAQCPLCARFVPLTDTALRTYQTMGAGERTRHVCKHHSINGRTYAEEATNG